MSWQTDQTPINYLKRRVVYYKKKKGKVNARILKLKSIWRPYLKTLYGTQSNYINALKSKVTYIEDLMQQFEAAIKKLERKNQKQ